MLICPVTAKWEFQSRAPSPPAGSYDRACAVLVARRGARAGARGHDASSLARRRFCSGPPAARRRGDGLVGRRGNPLGSPGAADKGFRCWTFCLSPSALKADGAFKRRLQDWSTCLCLYKKNLDFL